MDSDGDLDVIADRQIKLNDGMGQFTDGQRLGATTDIAFGDFNGDGFLDIVRATRSSGRVELNDGNAQFEESTRQDGIRPTSVVVADFNNDGNLDLVFGSNEGITTWLNDGNGAFENTSSLGDIFSPIEELVAGDFNGDGLIDVMFGAPESSLRELRNVGNGQFEFGRFIGFDADRLQAADFDGDGDLDLIGSGNEDLIFFNELQFFRQVLSPGQGNSGEPLIAGDFDGDGDLDLFVDDRVFENQDSFAADVNGDMTVNFTDFLTISANFGATEDVTFSDGDVDEDGDVDFADFLILSAEFVGF